MANYKEDRMSNIRDGDLYRTIKIENSTFEIRYGYYEEYERGRSEPVPIYPNLLANPEYTGDGTPIVTAMQEPCRHFDGCDRELGCYGCRHFQECEDLIGLCRLESNRQKTD